MNEGGLFLLYEEIGISILNMIFYQSRDNRKVFKQIQKERLDNLFVNFKDSKYLFVNLACTHFVATVVFVLHIFNAHPLILTWPLT